MSGGGRVPRKRKGDPEQLSLSAAPVQDASLVDETRRRYLNYALSVITARALPDVRDGLKPVQRRILYTMLHELKLRPEARFRKSAAIVGDVMGKFHPHGDGAIYDALVRLSQPFTLGAPLVHGRGNFGSPDGDAAAAMRYTEAKLQPLALELMRELHQSTVSFRPNYDGTREEPTVLPARIPHLLVNGSQGIAVGMATAIPPHNLREVIDATVALIDDPELELKAVLRHIKGPDFPTGGELQASRTQLEQVYSRGQGSWKLRGQWKIEPSERGNPFLVITAIPYMVERRALVEKIADVILSRKVPQLLDVRDESTDVCRIVCEIKRDSDVELITAYLCRHTPLEQNVPVNLTALVPVGDMELPAPRRLDLVATLRHFLRFRMQVTERRLRHELREIERRIHILEALAIVFDALDEVIALIRESQGRADAARRLQDRFRFSEMQTDAILQLRLYRLAKLEILAIRTELAEQRAEAERLRQLLGDEAARWQLIRTELGELRAEFGAARRTKVVARDVQPAFDAADFIVDEDAMVLVSQQGWIKRQQRIKDVASTRVRDGDAPLAVIAGSTRSELVLFSNQGVAYVTRLVEVPATSGYGAPVQSLFRLRDGERVVTALGLDPRFLPVPAPSVPLEAPEPPFVVVVTRGGLCLRLSLRAHREVSTRTGRRYCRLRAGDEVLFVGLAPEGASLAVVSALGRASVCALDQVPLLSGPGRGVTLMKLADGDALLGAKVLTQASDALVLVHASGKQFPVSERKYSRVQRGAKGNLLFKRGQAASVVAEPVTLPVFPDTDDKG
ncbi:MAG: DNA gyrase/topoisomerase IV subunit A [Polyangiales bacterium]